MKKTGTNLAEIGLALCIIGGLFAFVVPSLANKMTNKSIETIYSKQISVLNQVVQYIVIEDSSSFVYSVYGASIRDRFASRFNITNDCALAGDAVRCNIKGTDKALNNYKTFNGKYLDKSYFDDGGFVTADGTLYLFKEKRITDDYAGYILSIDINGYGKGPNLMGHDVFMFQIVQYGDILPMGTIDTLFEDEPRERFCSPKSVSNQNGFTCAQYAIIDKKYFAKLR